MKNREQIYKETVKEKYSEYIPKNPTPEQIDKAMRKANIFAVKNTNIIFNEQTKK